MFKKPNDLNKKIKKMNFLILIFIDCIQSSKMIQFMNLIFSKFLESENVYLTFRIPAFHTRPLPPYRPTYRHRSCPTRH